MGEAFLMAKVKFVESLSDREKNIYWKKEKSYENKN